MEEETRTVQRSTTSAQPVRDTTHRRTGQTGGPARELRLPSERVSSRATTLWTVQSLLYIGIPLAALVAAAIIWEPARVWLIAPIIAGGVLFVATVVIEPLVRRHVHRWEITDKAIYSVTGWVRVEWRVTPVSRVQTVDAVRGPLAQILGLSTLRVTTASAHGAVDIEGIDQHIAREAIARLSALAELSEGDAT